MVERIHAFSIPLCPSQPGMTEQERKRRCADVERLVCAAMPSVQRLPDQCVQLERRLRGAGSYLELTYDLVAIPQGALFGGKRNGQRGPQESRLADLFRELSRLKEEAHHTAIRVGELAKLAALLPRADTDAQEEVMSDLPECDRQLWSVFDRRRDQPFSIHFTDEVVETRGELFPSHSLERFDRSIRCQVLDVGRDRAELANIEWLDDRANIALTGAALPSRLDLFRSPAERAQKTNAWFLLYAASYSKMRVEARIRLGLRLPDLRPQHLELVEFANIEALQDRLRQISAVALAEHP